MYTCILRLRATKFGTAVSLGHGEDSYGATYFHQMGRKSRDQCYYSLPKIGRTRCVEIVRGGLSIWCIAFCGFPDAANTQFVGYLLQRFCFLSISHTLTFS